MHPRLARSPSRDTSPIGKSLEREEADISNRDELQRRIANLEPACEVGRREELFGGRGGCVPCECEDMVIEMALTEGIDDGATLFARSASDQECLKRHDGG